MSCNHQKFIPKGNEVTWTLMNWEGNDDNKDLVVNMCKICHLLYWEIKN